MGAQALNQIQTQVSHMIRAAHRVIPLQNQIPKRNKKGHCRRNESFQSKVPRIINLEQMLSHTLVLLKYKENEAKIRAKLLKDQNLYQAQKQDRIKDTLSQNQTVKRRMMHIIKRGMIIPVSGINLKTI